MVIRLVELIFDKINIILYNINDLTDARGAHFCFYKPYDQIIAVQMANGGAGDTDTFRDCGNQSAR